MNIFQLFGRKQDLNHPPTQVENGDYMLTTSIRLQIAPSPQTLSLKDFVDTVWEGDQV